MFLAALCVPLAARAEAVDEILARSFEARGGLEKIRAVRSARFTGKMSMAPGTEAPVVLEWKRPDLLRIDFTIQARTGSMIYDGKTGWMSMGGTSVETVPGDQLKDLEAQADFDGPFVDYKEKGHQVEYLGAAKIDGIEVHKLGLTRKNGDLSTIYLDGQSFLEIKQEGKRSLRGQQMEFEASSGDYRRVEGLMFSFSVKTSLKGSPVGQAITIEKIELDPELADSRFSREGLTAAAPAAPAATPATPAAPGPAAAPAPASTPAGTP